MKLTEEEVRQEFRKHRKDKVFAKCWSATNDSFYEWCSLYLDYQHITDPFIEWLKGLLRSSFDLDIMESSIPALLEQVELLIEEYREWGIDFGGAIGLINNTYRETRSYGIDLIYEF